MLLFVIKKTFFDVWDHLFSIFLLNVGFLLILGVGTYLIHFLSFHPALFFFAIGIAVVMLMLYIGVASMMARDIAHYRSPAFRKFFHYLREVWKSAVIFCFFIFIQLLIALIIFPWYARMGGIPGIVIPGLFFWLSLSWWLSSQYYFPLRCQLDPEIRKILRKSLILFFDNALFTIVLGFGTLILLILSGFTAFLFPGIGSMLLWHQVGLKLRLYKYAYLEEHPDARRNAIPWDTLLQEEREKVGTRTLKNTIFPWKE